MQYVVQLLICITLLSSFSVAKTKDSKKTKEKVIYHVSYSGATLKTCKIKQRASSSNHHETIIQCTYSCLLPQGNLDAKTMHENVYCRN